MIPKICIEKLDSDNESDSEEEKVVRTAWG